MTAASGARGARTAVRHSSPARSVEMAIVPISPTTDGVVGQEGSGPSRRLSSSRPPDLPTVPATGGGGPRTAHRWVSDDSTNGLVGSNSYPSPPASIPDGPPPNGLRRADPSADARSNFHRRPQVLRGAPGFRRRKHGCAPRSLSSPRRGANRIWRDQARAKPAGRRPRRRLPRRTPPRTTGRRARRRRRPRRPRVSDRRSRP